MTCTMIYNKIRAKKAQITPKITPGHTNSYFCRKLLYTFVDSKVSYFNNMIMMGDYNNVVDPNIDIIRTYPTLNSDIEDVTTFTDILANRNLVDTYLSLRDEFSGPMMMTNKSFRQHEDGTWHTTYKRLDRAYHHPSLDDRILIDVLNSKYINTNPIALNSSHCPIEVTITDPDNDDVKVYHDAWRMNTFIANQPKHKNYIIRKRDEAWQKCKNRSDAVKTKHWFAF